MPHKPPSWLEDRLVPRPAKDASLGRGVVGTFGSTTHVLEEAIANASHEVGEGHGARLVAAVGSIVLLLRRTSSPLRTTILRDGAGRRGCVMLGRVLAHHAVVGPHQLRLARELVGRVGHLGLARHRDRVFAAVRQLHRHLGVVEASLLDLLPVLQVSREGEVGFFGFAVVGLCEGF